MYDNSLLKMYIILNFFLFLSSFYIFFRVTPDLTKKREYIVFRIFLVAFQFYLVMNSLWTLQEFDVVQIPHILFVIICFLSYTSVVFNAFCFYAFIMVRFDFSFGKKTWATIIGLVPFIAAEILLGISLANGMIFTVTPDNHVITGPAYLALAACSFIYFAVIVRVSTMRAIRTRTMYSRKDAISLTLSVIFLIFWVIIDGYFDRITIIPIAIFSIIMFLFISLLQSNVYTDALTQMNNRRKTEEYLNSQIDNLSESSPLYLFIIDIDSFKEINDTYGHAEGDAVLVLFSSVAKKVVGTHSGFTARYGGDEFVLAWRPQKDSDIDPETLLGEIRDQFTEACKNDNKPYEITFSCGCVRCTDPKKTVASYMKEADEKMYRNKRIFHGIYHK